jgi:tryptophan synthase alpha chain
MTRYTAMFEGCAARGEGVFGAYLMIGDPNAERSATLLDALVEGGADMVELGIPFSDPVADGPVVQAAGERALRAGVRTADCLRILAAFRRRHPHIPIGILTYANIVAARGVAMFAEDLASAGVDSLLVADVPSLEAEPYAAAARQAGIDLVMIAAPNTPRAALARIARLSSGYTYCVARPGVTGARSTLKLDHESLFEALRELGAPPPIIGFGISRPGQVRRAIAAGAAGAVSGSALVDVVANGGRPAELAALVRKLKAATLPVEVGLGICNLAR